MEPIQPLHSGSRSVQSDMKTDTDKKVSIGNQEQSVQNESRDTVNISEEAAVKNAALNEAKSIADQVAEQNQLAQQSASHLTGLHLLGANLNVNDQGAIIDSIVNGL